MLMDMQRAKRAHCKSKIGRHNQDRSRRATNNRHILTWPVLTVATGLGFPTRPLWSAVTHQKVAVSAPLEPCLSSSVTAGVCYLYQTLLSKIYMIWYELVCLQRQARLSRHCTSTIILYAYVHVRTVRTRAAAMASFTTADPKSAVTVSNRQWVATRHVATVVRTIPAPTGAARPVSATNPTAPIPVAAGLPFTGLIFWYFVNKTVCLGVSLMCSIFYVS